MVSAMNRYFVYFRYDEGINYNLSYLNIVVVFITYIFIVFARQR